MTSSKSRARKTSGTIGQKPKVPRGARGLGDFPSRNDEAMTRTQTLATDQVNRINKKLMRKVESMMSHERNA